MKTYIVIGAGILGASTAYHLAKAGAKVRLVDRQDQGQATDAAAGIVSPWITQRRNQAWYRLVKEGAKYLPVLVQELEETGEKETGYDRVGAIILHTEEERLDKIEKLAYERRKDAPEIGEITRLSATQTQAIFPPLADHYGSVHISGAARVNGRALRNALIQAAQKHGASFHRADVVLDFQGNRVTGIKEGSRHFSADQVIITAGAWSKELLQPLGIQFLLTIQKGQIVHLEMPGTDTGQWPVVMPPTNHYLLTFDQGRIVIGATHENEAGFDYRVTAGGLHEIMNKALTVAPGLATCTLLETRVGFRPYTPGFLPVFGSLPDYEGVIIANGLGASGLTSGPYLGSELAKLALGRPTQLPLGDYDLAQALGEMES